jgi:hypothetical protein
MLFWHVPAPNEALLITGSKRRGNEAPFRIVTGRGSLVLPIIRKASSLSLALHVAEIIEDCVTVQGIKLNVQAVAAFKVGDDPASIANAARRFLTEQERMEELVGRVLAGHLRSIVGALTVEEIIRERGRLAQEVTEGSHTEMEKLGLTLDAMQNQEIADGSGYIENIAAPRVVAVASQARIAAAKADQEAFEREQQAAALKAQYQRDTTIKQAGFQAEVEQARARAARAGPLAVANSAQGRGGWRRPGGCDFVPGRHAGGSWEGARGGQGGWAAPGAGRRRWVRLCSWAACWRVLGACRPGARWVGGAPRLRLCSWVACWQALAACHPGARWVGAPSRGKVGGRAIRGEVGGGAIQGQGGWTAAGTGKVG